MYVPPTVEGCILHAYNFSRDFHVMTIPHFPYDAYDAEDPQNSRTISRTRTFRAGRAPKSPDAQRDNKWGSLIRRPRKSAADRMVRYSHFALLMAGFLLAVEVFHYDYTVGVELTTDCIIAPNGLAL